MRAVNLVPPELRARVPGDGDPRVAYGVFGGLVVLLVMVLIAVSLSNKATTLNDEAAALRAQAERHQVQAKPVQAFNDFAGVAESRTLLVGGLAASRFPWGKALYNLSESLPSDVTIDTIKAVTAEATVAAANQATGAAGVASANEATLELAGCTSSWIGYSRLTVWLENMPGVANVTTSQSSDSGASGSANEGAKDANAKRSANCGPSPLKFTTKVHYQPREVDLIGLPKITAPAAPAGASGATGASPAAGAPAAASTAAAGQ